jgi:hypothetical protein
MFEVKSRKLCSPEEQQPSSEAGHLTSQADRIEDFALKVREQDMLGLRNLPWKPSESPLAPPVIDFNWLLAQPTLPFLLQAIPAPTLYQSLMHHGLEDSVEIVEWLRGKQLLQVLDLDIWESASGNHIEDIAAPRFCQWLRVWLEIGKDFAAERVLDLEEEVLTLLFSRLLEIEPEDLERVTEDHRDDYWRTMDGMFLLKCKDPDPEVYEMVYQLIDALYAKNSRLAHAILAHSAMLIRQENLQEALRWRNGRLADHGFVSRDEARDFLRPVDLQKVLASIKQALILEEKRKAAHEKLQKMAPSHFQGEEADPEVFESVILTLSEMDREVAHRLVEGVLGMDELRLLTESASPLEEQVLDDEEVMTGAAEKIVVQVQKLLAFVEVGALRNKSACTTLVEKAFGLIAQKDIHTAAQLKARVARVSNSFLAAVSLSYENDAMVRSLDVVRGALNVGLEWLLANPETLWTVPPSSSDEECAALIVEKVGPEFVFKLGWSLINAESKQIATTLCNLAKLDGQTYSLWSQTRLVEFDDGAKLQLDLEQLLKLGRFVEIRGWLRNIRTQIPEAVSHVLEALLNRVPYFPEILAEDDVQGRGSVTLRPFRNLDDLRRVQGFREQLSNLLRA